MTDPRAHSLFAEAPLYGRGPTLTGALPKPYQIDDDYGIVAVGACDADALTEMFLDQGLHPVWMRMGMA